jgi:hypothetical protein
VGLASLKELLRRVDFAKMIRAFRAVVAIAGVVSGIGFVRAGLWFLREAGGAGKASENQLAGSVTTQLPAAMYPLAAMGLGLGLVLLFLSGREMLRLWRSGPRPG